MRQVRGNSRVDLRSGPCSVCGESVADHFDPQNRKVTCEVVLARKTLPVNEGRLFTLKLKHSAAARASALETVRARPDGQWQARVGGRLRGKTVVGTSKRSVERVVHDHYNNALLGFVTRPR